MMPEGAGTMGPRSGPTDALPPANLPDPAGDGPERKAYPDETPVRIDRPRYHWYHKMYAVLFITFCLEVGIFLVVFPWTDYWEANYFSGLVPELREWWENPYVRGAVSGLGAVNVWIAVVEAFRLRRFARH